MNDGLSINVKKWFEDKAAAVSLTYDAAWGTHAYDPDYQRRLEKVAHEIIKRKMSLAFELSSWVYLREDCAHWLPSMRTELVPNDIHFFGHGHLHDNYDEKSYDDAYVLFKQCYDLMQDWGLKPKAYGYPYGKCSKESTRQANQAAGWICSRSIELNPKKLYMCSGEVTEPVDWYALPALPIANDVDNYFQNNAEIRPVLLNAIDQGAWIIFMYHNIDLPDYAGWYKWDEFIKDLEMLQESDVWVGNMDDVACYIQEKNNFYFEYQLISKSELQTDYELKICDDLDNSIFEQPLTLEVTIQGNFKPGIATLRSAENETVYKCALINNKFLVNMKPDERKYTLSLSE
ncbi:hypothetical protein JW960_19080 [candidate division KSB1 bacterium]|nr:hypothetical protein [candidate division KSB1 bacterium]